MIVTHSVSKAYGRTLVVDNVSLTIPGGGLTSIIGPNGAGKSTLLSLMARLLPMNAGTVTVDGLDVTQTPDAQLAQRLSILRQDNHLSSRLTVHDLVSFGRYPYSKGRLTTEDKVYIERALAYLELEPLAGRFLDELSGGQRQRAFVAMVLCQDTDYVLLDEPLNNLDMKHARGMMKILHRATRELGKTVVLVLHDINFAAWYSDRIIAMREGKVWASGSVETIIQPEMLGQIYDMEISIHRIGTRPIALFYE
ncbi:iron ABC transporter ATP-binding protein [Cephaloticoccus primus]|uniref:Iron ABC transporter ATP-binding protein n=1 Tax=Cephaloticoccus primus TaxID=1548207 RepID=A0A139SLC0_9BACT|nr:ABC transporter ATP-binding protein [Cephaloticoccus primus]KXU35346.1 iron ABC transporter ATP-binding protein [Cephaloticoccus primus]